MTMFRRRAAALLSGSVLLAGAGGCSIATSPALDAVLSAVSEHPTYALADAPQPQVTLQHGGGPAIVLSGCPEAPAAILERRGAQGWMQEGTRGVFCQAVYTMELDTITAGAARQFRIGVSRAGTFRVRVLIGPDPAAPQRTVLTNEFEVQ